MSKYLGTIVVAAATLGIEISLTRILSVVTWYYLAFFAISIAMVGMTAGALTVYFKKRWFRGTNGSSHLARACLLFSWATPVALVYICFNPMIVEPRYEFLMLLTTALLWMAPFFFSGVAISGVLTRSGLPIGLIYGADLFGAASGCLLVLAGLSAVDPMSLILMCAAAGALAAFCFGSGSAGSGLERKVAVVTAIVFVVGAAWNTQNASGIRPRYVKNKTIDPAEVTFERWNTHSQVTMGPLLRDVTQYWGRGFRAPAITADTELYKLVIDGSAATYMQKMSAPSDVENLRYDVTNFGHHLGRRGLACIVGVGGGRDVQSAVLFEYPKVLGIEINPVFIELLNGEYASFAGLSSRPEVTLVVDEARSYLTRSPEQCEWIQMSLIDTWAATAAGAFSLSENALYTVEAFRVLFAKLADDGLISVSRWYHETQEYEMVRLMGLVMEILLESGVANPSDHIIVVRGRNVATVLVSRRPFSQDEIEKGRFIAEEYGFFGIHWPGSNSARPLFSQVIGAGSLKELREVLSSQPVALAPPTDDRPYFFHMLKLGNLRYALSLEDTTITGNIKAMTYLLTLIVVLLVLAGLTVVLPLVFTSSFSASELARRPRFRAGAQYFMLIGLGFMFVEIALIQRFSVYLGHPIYALGVLLFTIILATGVGSIFSERLSLEARRIGAFPVVIALTLVVYTALTSAVIARTITLELIFRATITVFMLFPVGFLLGICFPLGMRMMRPEEEDFTPWFWAMNGIMGVLGSCLAVFVSIHVGISTSLLLGATCYALLVLPTRRLLMTADR